MRKRKLRSMLVFQQVSYGSGQHRLRALIPFGRVAVVYRRRSQRLGGLKNPTSSLNIFGPLNPKPLNACFFGLVCLPRMDAGLVLPGPKLLLPLFCSPSCSLLRD